MKGLLDGKVAVITGAGSGTGQGSAEARLFAKEGARVVVADLDSPTAHGVADELGEQGLFVPLDVTDHESWATLVTQTQNVFGQVDILVNNAGVWLDKGILETSPAEYRRVTEVNQVGVFLGMAAVAPRMKASGGGSIVNVSSVAGLKGAGQPFAYAASKWAVRGMSRAAAAELTPHGIRVNAIFPGVIDTPMIGGGQEVLERLASMIPLGRVGRPEEVANLALFLASDLSSYISGAEIAIDAGVTA